MRGLTEDMVVRVCVWSRVQAHDVVCAAVCSGVPVAWLRSADVLLIPVGRPAPAGGVAGLFARYPGCSVVVVSGAPHLVHLRGRVASPHGATGDPWVLGALAHTRCSGAVALGSDPGGPAALLVTARVPGGG